MISGPPDVEGNGECAESDKVDLVIAPAAHDLCEATEDFDLASSRLAWACDCGCELIGDQLQALEWLCQDCDDSRTVMEAFKAS